MGDGVGVAVAGGVGEGVGDGAGVGVFVAVGTNAGVGVGWGVLHAVARSPASRRVTTARVVFKVSSTGALSDAFSKKGLRQDSR